VNAIAPEAQGPAGTDLASKTVPTLCRLCPAHCGLLAVVEDGRLVAMKGDHDNPLHKGYSCPTGRALPDMHNNPARLLHSQKRRADGGYEPITVAAAMDEVAAKLRQLIETHGPRSVAIYTGTAGFSYPAASGMGVALMNAIGSPMIFGAATIDQPGKQISQAVHGQWMGGDIDFEEADTWVIIGGNPVISRSVGVPAFNPAQRLKEAQQRGMKLVVIDPRRTETARRATLHIQPRPGEDPTILAGMINVVIAEGLYDRDFIAENVTGFEALAEQVAPFTPDYVAGRADFPAEQLVEATRLFARPSGSGGGLVTLGTGPSFSMHGNLGEYLALCLTTICGHWPRAGRRMNRPNALLPAVTPKAQASAPTPAWGFGEKLRVRGFTNAACGLPTAALSDEILLEGEGQVRALLCVGSNPMSAWPDQRKTQAALEKLELLVTTDVVMSQTSRMADYVVATKMTLETPGMTRGVEAAKYYAIGGGFGQAYAQYAARVVDPPAGSDLIEEWEFFRGVAKRMDLDLALTLGFGFGTAQEAPPLRVELPRDEDLTTEELFAKMCATSRIPFEEIRSHPHGKVFEVEAIVGEKDAGWTERLDVGNPDLMRELAEVAAADFRAEQQIPGYPFRVTPRRANNYVNSIGPNLSKLHQGKPYNPAYMHPDDLAELGLKAGDAVTIRSRHDFIPSIVEADDTLRRKIIAMTHAFGGLADEDDKFTEQGSNVGRLVPNDFEYDPITGIPRMGNIPVSVTAGWG
jgi:anaerobic selenocysteine-containing dehydrogenase